MDKKKKIVIITLIAVAVLAIIGGIIFFVIKKISKKEDTLNNDSSISEVLDDEGPNKDDNATEQEQAASNEGSQDSNNGAQLDDKISEEELKEKLDAFDNIDLDASVQDSGSTISVTIKGNGLSLIQKYNFKDDVLTSIYVDWVLENEEYAKVIYENLKGENEFISDLVINGNTVSYNDIDYYNSIGPISKEELLTLLKEEELEVN